MADKLRYVAAALCALGLTLPSFIVGLIGLIALSVYMPFAGIFAGFCMDIVFGNPAWLPSFIAYPFTICASLLAVASIALAKYLR